MWGVGRLVVFARMVSVLAGATASVEPSLVQASTPPPQMVEIPAGVFKASVSLSSESSATKDKKESDEVRISSFFIDRLPVTNAEFLSFVKRNPRWQRDRAPRLMVDSEYLGHWQSPTELGKTALAEQPVSNVGWFAARAYCAARGGRLPTEAEWEYVASASETQADARQDEKWRKRILDWYAIPTPKTLAKVGHSSPNFYGVFDLHGLIWEWVLDFSSTMMSGDSRDSGGSDRMLFCGAAAIGSGTKQDYASFMRYAFRSSLQARYSSRNLGFRCAADLVPTIEVKP